MANERLTDWYPGTTKPVRSGVYERDGRVDGVVYFAYYDARRQTWGIDVWTIKQAHAKRAQVSAFQDISWRGIKKRSST